jgi:hypothetical protein
MTLLIVNAIIGLAFILLFVLFNIDTRFEFRRRHPDVVIDSSWANAVNTAIRIIILAIVPGANIIALYIIFFEYNRLQEETIADVYKKYHKGEE